MLQEMARGTGRPVAELLERAVAEYRDRQFWEAVNKGYAELRADSEVWAAEEAERQAWDGTLMDGLDATERWSADGMPQMRAGEGQQT
jgi:hypothetical protein